jgi:hypothetical protein
MLTISIISKITASRTELRNRNVFLHHRRKVADETIAVRFIAQFRKAT